MTLNLRYDKEKFYWPKATRLKKDCSGLFNCMKMKEFCDVLFEDEQPYLTVRSVSQAMSYMKARYKCLKYLIRNSALIFLLFLHKGPLRPEEILFALLSMIPFHPK